LFGLADWVLDRFVARRTTLHRLQYQATRLREKPVAWSLVVVLGANVVVFWSLAAAAAAGRIDLGRAVIFAQLAMGVSAVAFGGLSWVMDGAAAPVVAVLRLQDAMAPAGALSSGTRDSARTPAQQIRFRNVSFAYPGSSGSSGSPGSRGSGSLVL